MSNVEISNTVLSRKIIWLWGAAVALFFIAIRDSSTSNEVAGKIAAYFPIVKGQLEKGTPIGLVASRYFAFAVLAMPVATLFLLKNDDLLARAQIRVSRSGGVWQWLLIVLFLGMPFCMGMLIFFYFAPIEVSENPRLMGQIIAHAMLNTYLGLLVFGSICIVAVVLFIFVLVCCFVSPILVLLNSKIVEKYRGGNV